MDWLETAFERLSKSLGDTFLSIQIWRIIIAGIILIFSFAIRRMIVNFITKLIAKVTAKTRIKFDNEFADAVNPPVRLLIIIIGLYFAVRVLGLKVTSESFSGHLIRSLVIYTVFWAVYRTADILARLVERVNKKTGTVMDKLLVPFINKGIKAIVIIIGISVIAKEWKYDLGALLTGLGLGGLAFALAAQETLANLFGGIAIMLDKPFNIGDYIQCNDLEGTVEDIGFRSTRIRTSDQTLITVPNSTIAKASITNCSKREKRTVKFNLPVKYGTTAEQMEKLINRIGEMLKNHSYIYPETVLVYFDGFGTNAYNLVISFNTQTANFKNFIAVKEDVNLNILRILDELGVEVSIPATGVYLANTQK